MTKRHRPGWSKHMRHPKKPPVEEQNKKLREAYEREMDHQEAYLRQLNRDNGIGVKR